MGSAELRWEGEASWANQGTGKGQCAQEVPLGGKNHKPERRLWVEKSSWKFPYQGYLKAHLPSVCPLLRMMYTAGLGDTNLYLLSQCND